MSFEIPRLTAADALSTASTAPVLNQTSLTTSMKGLERSSQSLLFVDGSVADYQQLVTGVAAGTEVYVLDPTRDAVTQITNVLLGREGIASLHVVSHGEAGGLDFGSSRLNLSDLPEYAAQLQSWGKALTDDADILLYGCNVAKGELGKAFTSILSQLTGADVAASDDLTGSADKGGDWVLEYQTGRIETGLALSQATRDAYADVLPFAAATNFTVGTTPRSVAIGDFNKDGNADIAAANQSSNNVSILLGDGTGSFAAATNFTVGTAPFSVAIGDFNKDGNADIAAANANSQNVSILLGDGTGSFAAATNFTVGTTPFSVAIGDFNKDGNADIAAANTNSQNVSILLGDGTGSFAAATNFTVGANPSSVAIGDFNKDGNADIANANSKNVSILLGDGTGSFAAATNFTVGASPVSVAVGDFNGDGNADIAAANRNSQNVSILLGTGTGNFAAATNFTVGTNPGSVTVGDFNKDGNADIAAANANSQNVSILLGDGTGSFAAATNFTVGTNPYSVAIGDFNEDGYADIAAANTNSSNVSVLLNTSTPPLPTISLSTSTASITEGNMGNFSVSRTGTTGALTINLTIDAASTAVLGSSNDYTLDVGGTPVTVAGNNFSVTIPDTQSSVTLNMAALAEAIGFAEAADLLKLNLATGTGYDVGSSNNASITIAQNGFTVINTSDTGEGSLRQAVLNANAIAGTDTITFTGSTFTDGNTNNDTLTLTSGELGLTSDLTIDSSGGDPVTISGNNAFRVFNIGAGATVTLSALTINNGNSSVGGGIYNNGTLTVSNSTLSGNTASGGGGIWNEGSTLTLNNSTLSSNTAGGAGGGITINGGTVSLNNSTLSGNTAGDFGGGIDNNGRLTVSNSTFSGNTATNRGGALWNFNTLDLSNSTFSGNTAVIGGGLYNVNTINTLQNTLFADSSLYNFVPDATNRVGTAAALGLDLVLRNNGGSTQTHALLPGSTAIDTGTSTGAPTTDQRGISHVGAVDIGAFESRGFNLSLTGGNNQNTNTGTAFTNPLTVNVTSSFSEPVTGGTVDFSPPGSGASATVTSNPATIDAAGNASGTATANNSSGSYAIAAGGNGFATPASITLTNNNVAPVLTFPGAAISYTENGLAALLDSTATLTDTDSPDFSGGILNVSLTAGSDASDRLEIRNQGTGTNQISVTGNTISYNFGAGAVAIGSFGGGSGSSPLTILLNPAADAQSVRDLIRNLTYRTVSEDPSATPRTVSVTLNDGDGGTSAAVTKTINVTANNDAPTLTGNATLAAVLENSTNPSGSNLVSLFSTLFSDIDTGANLSGLAIVGNSANSTQGQWQYSTNGTTWATVGAVAEGATALALSASTLVRFVPAIHYYGTPPGLTVRALDNTYSSGFSDSTTRKTFDTTNNGGTSAIAATTATIDTSITEVLPNLLWRNTGGGENAVWQLKSFVLQSAYYLPTTDPSWQIASSSADFNNDGIADILWRNQVTGENAIWQMNNTGLESGTFITPVADLNWQMVGTGDFDGDQKSDILWRNRFSGENAIWQMDGTTLKSGDFITLVASQSWQIAGTGDFDGDQKSDILWRNQATGENAIWQMNGATLKSGDFITSVAGQSWQIAGTADFDGDGKSDILWRNRATGENAIWEMSGATLQSGYFITSLVDLNWQIAGAADLGGDGTPDILWRNTQAAKVMIWDMSGVSFAQPSYLQTYDLTDVVDPQWKVKPFVADLEPADLSVA